MLSGNKHLGEVLVIDDEAGVRRVVRITLEKAGYQVLEAKDGMEAMRVLSSREHPSLVDTVVTDSRIPKINGVEAISFLRKEYPNIPLIVLTADPDLDRASDLLTKGIVDCLLKPVEAETLKSTVARGIEQHQIFLTTRRPRNEHHGNTALL
jgi:two-component system chemotaxis response regulator CheY